MSHQITQEHLGDNAQHSHDSYENRHVYRAEVHLQFQIDKNTRILASFRQVGE
jgi:hypothetical protein